MTENTENQQANLKFFNALSGQMQIQLSEPAQPIPGMANLVSSPEAKVTAVKLKLQVFLREESAFRDLTEAEYHLTVLKQSELQLRSESEDITTHQAPNGQSFSVMDLQAVIENHELQSRNQSDWLGGVDVHHAFFEGIHQDEEGVWEVYWGS